MWRCVNDVFGYCKSEPDGAKNAHVIEKEIYSSNFSQEKQKVAVSVSGATCSKSPQSCKHYMTTKDVYPEVKENIIEQDSVKAEAQQIEKRAPIQDRLQEVTKESESKLFDEQTEWQKEWKDMPEYIQEDISPFRSIIVHFETQEDMKKFASLVQQRITQATKYIWFPEVTKQKLLNKKYISEI